MKTKFSPFTRFIYGRLMQINKDTLLKTNETFKTVLSLAARRQNKLQNGKQIYTVYNQFTLHNFKNTPIQFIRERTHYCHIICDVIDPVPRKENSFERGIYLTLYFTAIVLIKGNKINKVNTHFKPKWPTRSVTRFPYSM